MDVQAIQTVERHARMNPQENGLRPRAETLQRQVKPLLRLSIRFEAH